jgi:hypothetical protein
MNGTATITIDGTAILEVLDRRGWTKRSFGRGGGPVCLYGAVRLCAPVKGDAFLIEQVMARRGRGTDWNDASGTTLEMVREFASTGLEVTDDDLAETYGPTWRGIVVLVREAATLKRKQVRELAATWDAARTATRTAAWNAAWNAGGDATRTAAWNAWNAAGSAAGDAKRANPRVIAGDAASAIVTYDLAGTEGYTVEHRELILEPWESVMGNAARQAIGKGRET